MSVTRTLNHCDEVVVYSMPPGPPLVGPVTVTTGGAAGDGRVEVSTTPPSEEVPPVVPTGETVGPFNATPLTQIRMHYFAEPGRPQTVDVTIATAPPTHG